MSFRQHLMHGKELWWLYSFGIAEQLNNQQFTAAAEKWSRVDRDGRWLVPHKIGGWKQAIKGGESTKTIEGKPRIAYKDKQNIKQRCFQTSSKNINNNKQRHVSQQTNTKTITEKKRKKETVMKTHPSQLRRYNRTNIRQKKRKKNAIENLNSEQ